jgi:hypothetical protein
MGPINRIIRPAGNRVFGLYADRPLKDQTYLGPTIKRSIITGSCSISRTHTPIRTYKPMKYAIIFALN